jgi:hypothetical protein
MVVHGAFSDWGWTINPILGTIDVTADQAYDESIVIRGTPRPPMLYILWAALS